MKISDFERLAILGEGAFGKVYRVRYVQNDHKFALKRIEKSLLIRVRNNFTPGRKAKTSAYIKGDDALPRPPTNR